MNKYVPQQLYFASISILTIRLPVHHVDNHKNILYAQIFSKPSQLVVHRVSPDGLTATQDT
jgi:hypothetical protein